MNITRNILKLNSIHIELYREHYRILTSSTIKTPEAAPCIICGIITLYCRILINRNTDILSRICRNLIHITAVCIVRISYPCIGSLAISTGCTWNTIRPVLTIKTSEAAPSIIRSRITLCCGFLIVCKTDESLAGWIIAYPGSVHIISVLYPGIINLSIFTGSSGNTLGACVAFYPLYPDRSPPTTGR